MERWVDTGGSNLAPSTNTPWSSFQILGDDAVSPAGARPYLSEGSTTGGTDDRFTPGREVELDLFKY